MSVPSLAGGSRGKKHPGTAGGLGGRTGLQTPTRAPVIQRWLWKPFRCLLHFRFPARGISTVGQA